MAPRGSDGPAVLRVRVAAVIPYEAGLVLVRHRMGERTYHLLPGGGVEAGETLEAALLREVREETGLQVALDKPLFVSDTLSPDGSRHIVNLTFLTRAVGGALTDTCEDPRVEGIDIVPAAGLAALDLRPPMAAQLAEAALSGFAAPARYLGALWKDET